MMHIGAAGVLVIGAGQAGFELASSLRDLGYDGVIRIIGDEPELPYQRPPLSKAFLTTSLETSSLQYQGNGYFAKARIDLVTDARAVSIDRVARRVQLATGQGLEYGHLVLATGARNRMLSGISELQGVHSLRDLADAMALRKRLDSVKKMVVVGAGFLGLEIAAAARSRGITVHVLEAASLPLSRNASPMISRFFIDHHRALGVHLKLGSCVTKLHGTNSSLEAVECDDGTLIEADLVLISIGVVPNDELARNAELAVGNGIIVDSNLVTADPAISAIGDCASFPIANGAGMIRLESIQNAMDQARSVAERLVGRPRSYTAVPWFWSEQGGVRLQIAGLSTGYDLVVTRGKQEEGRFSTFCFKGGELVCVESINRPADHMAARKILTRHISLRPDEATDPDFNISGRAKAEPTTV
jgi:3-phenylpropionate/trans-cinnamate dioxygenase ferredoxin reductase component